MAFLNGSTVDVRNVSVPVATLPAYRFALRRVNCMPI